jgi:hypothetical protein
MIIDYMFSLQQRQHMLKCTNVLQKKFLSYSLKKKCLYFTYSSFLVINVCNQGKTLCSPFITLLSFYLRSGNIQLIELLSGFSGISNKLW